MNHGLDGTNLLLCDQRGVESIPSWWPHGLCSIPRRGLYLAALVPFPGSINQFRLDPATKKKKKKIQNIDSNHFRWKNMNFITVPKIIAQICTTNYKTYQQRKKENISYNTNLHPSWKKKKKNTNLHRIVKVKYRLFINATKKIMSLTSNNTK